MGDGTQFTIDIDVPGMSEPGADATWNSLKPDVFGVEEDANQHLFAPLFAAAFMAQRMTVLMRGVPTQGVPKLVRIRRWTPYLAQKRVRLKRKSPGVQLLLKQFQEFPHSDHDDGPDAAEMALRLGIELWNKSH